MDFCDSASAASADHLADALARIRPGPLHHPAGPSATHCDECGDPIPEARRKLVPGVRLCVGCQAENEKY